MHQSFLFLLTLLLLLTMFTGVTAEVVEEADALPYQQITQEEAYEIMQTRIDIIIVDARAQDEYDEGHIPGAIVLPHDQIADMGDALLELLPDKEQTILVYCRSGRRSKLAAEALAALGYTDVREFGGILTWPYEVVK